MAEKDFKRQAERSAELLTNDGYFNRFRQHLADGKSRRKAWEAVEGELPLGLRRYTNFTSLKDALKRERKGSLSQTVRLQK